MQQIRYKQSLKLVGLQFEQYILIVLHEISVLGNALQPAMASTQQQSDCSSCSTPDPPSQA